MVEVNKPFRLPVSGPHLDGSNVDRNFIILPGMSYNLRVQVGDGSKWGAWYEKRSTFAKLHKTTSAGISFGAIDGAPVRAGTVPHISDTTPNLKWEDADQAIFYYEVQLSKDAHFGDEGPVAMVYSNLIHGGISNPIRSYSVPKDFPLEPATTYFMRVKPRIQGDGVPVDWSKVMTFQEDANAKAKLHDQQVTTEVN